MLARAINRLPYRGVTQVLVKAVDGDVRFRQFVLAEGRSRYVAARQLVATEADYQAHYAAQQAVLRRWRAATLPGLLQGAEVTAGRLAAATGCAITVDTTRPLSPEELQTLNYSAEAAAPGALAQLLRFGFDCLDRPLRTHEARVRADLEVDEAGWKRTAFAVAADLLGLQITVPGRGRRAVVVPSWMAERATWIAEQGSSAA